MSDACAEPFLPLETGAASCYDRIGAETRTSLSAVLELFFFVCLSLFFILFSKKTFELCVTRCAIMKGVECVSTMPQDVSTACQRRREDLLCRCLLSHSNHSI